MSYIHWLLSKDIAKPFQIIEIKSDDLVSTIKIKFKSLELKLRNSELCYPSFFAENNTKKVQTPLAYKLDSDVLQLMNECDMFSEEH